MIMKRKSSSKREAMERMELSSEATRLLSDVQYLRKRSSKVGSGLRRGDPGWRWAGGDGSRRGITGNGFLCPKHSASPLLNIYLSSHPTLLRRLRVNFHPHH